MESGIVLANSIRKELRAAAHNLKELNELKEKNPELFSLVVKLDAIVSRWAASELQSFRKEEG